MEFVWLGLRAEERAGDHVCTGQQTAPRTRRRLLSRRDYIIDALTSSAAHTCLPVCAYENSRIYMVYMALASHSRVSRSTAPWPSPATTYASAAWPSARWPKRRPTSSLARHAKPAVVSGSAGVEGTRVARVMRPCLDVMLARCGGEREGGKGSGRERVGERRRRRVSASVARPALRRTEKSGGLTSSTPDDSVGDSSSTVNSGVWPYCHAQAWHAGAARRTTSGQQRRGPDSSPGQEEAKDAP